MAKDPLAEAGLHFDELNKLRVLEPEVDQKTRELKEECEDFVDSKSIPFSFIWNVPLVLSFILWRCTLAHVLNGKTVFFKCC